MYFRNIIDLRVEELKQYANELEIATHSSNKQELINEIKNSEEFSVLKKTDEIMRSNKITIDDYTLEVVYSAPRSMADFIECMEYIESSTFYYTGHYSVHIKQIGGTYHVVAFDETLIHDVNINVYELSGDYLAEITDPENDITFVFDPNDELESLISDKKHFNDYLDSDRAFSTQSEIDALLRTPTRAFDFSEPVDWYHG